MAAKKTGLGRGLGALLGDINLAPETQAGKDAAGDISRDTAMPMRTVPLDLLQRGVYQPRQDMHPDSLEDLAQSIRAQGLIQPIVVRPLTGRGAADQRTGAETRYEIIAGERRWRAAQMAGLQAVPVIVREIPDSAAIAIALIENIQRENLNPLEEAAALHRLIEEFELTHQQAADAVGRSRTAVSNLLRLMDLGGVASRLVQSGELEMGHARALLGLAQEKMQAEVARLVVKKGLSVRETERLVKRTLAGPAAKKGGTIDPDVRRLQDELGEKLCARVSIQHSPSGKGKLVVSYNSLDELDGILAHIR